ncbi:tetraacyldisaccharide 4'-kinase [Formosimonas limnophila]|uniref:Tetraacyldisaccharide 4'-kinase n=1 Tax=Formosimonas limnophila TaxID=1384487 RepID=A0A8J3CMF5_9BURK|nr:tetraacyldisaccharide 4'-kinase [Formosimonas limnophila]GHA68311.1 tetraacyldisaccharide 4'-kinase [Formosimonas limnophila]
MGINKKHRIKSTTSDQTYHGQWGAGFGQGMNGLSMSARAQREAAWLSLWGQRGLKNYALAPLAALFQLFSWLRRVFYQTGVMDVLFAPVPVVVVGGVMVGGVGKTPVVTALARTLRRAGYRPGIIARGYGGSNARQSRMPMAVTAMSDSRVVGDEPMLHFLNTECPVWVGADRARAAKALCSAHPEVDVLLCDDGLQHYRLSRDIEIVVMDGRGVGNGLCLPAGPLREGLSRLKEVDAVVWHRRGDTAMTCPVQQVTRNDVPHFVFESHIADAYDLLNPSDRVPLSFFSGKSVTMMAAIAQPVRFFRMLEGQGVVGLEVPLPDHAAFDLSVFRQSLVLASKYVLMTEKDAVKCRDILEKSNEDKGRYWVVPLDVVNTDDLARLQSFLLERLESLKSI